MVNQKHLEDSYPRLLTEVVKIAIYFEIQL